MKLHATCMKLGVVPSGWSSRRLTGAGDNGDGRRSVAREALTQSLPFTLAPNRDRGICTTARPTGGGASRVLPAAGALPALPNASDAGHPGTEIHSLSTIAGTCIAGACTRGGSAPGDAVAT